MPAKDYPASFRVKCGQALYRGLVGESVSGLITWDRLGTVAKEKYIVAAVAVLDVAKEDEKAAQPPSMFGAD